MLKSLLIQNFVLIEKAEIPFEKGFNVLSGESGAGKSAIMHALRLVCGDRFDTDLLRRGCDKGFVEAIFNVPLTLQSTFEKQDLEYSQECIVRREFASSGKSRALINDQVVNIQILKQITSSLIHILDQHATQQLRNSDYYRELLDTYGDLIPLRTSYSQAYEQQKALQKDLELFVQSTPQRFRDIERYEQELKELTEVNLQENEEEELFNEYSLLTSSQERQQLAHELSQGLNGERSIVAQMCRLRPTLMQLIKLDAALSAIVDGFESSLTELQEAATTLRNYYSNIDSDPQRLNALNDRLEKINSIKKRYGHSLPEIQKYQAEASARLNVLRNAEFEIENLQKKLSAIGSEVDALASELTKKRTKQSQLLEKAITKEMRTLNMPKAHFFCTLHPQTRNSTGDDLIEFLLSANLGEEAISVKEHASGGELARLMLALHLQLSGKNNISSLVFDEIDANIGGETATIVAAKLSALGEQQQLLCITHFPQVAKAAHHHLRITKKEGSQRTWTEIDVLDIAQRPLEWMRMSGVSKLQGVEL